MTDANEPKPDTAKGPREFWIRRMPSGFLSKGTMDIVYLEKSEVSNAPCLPDAIHVIEFAAYDQLAKELASYKKIYDDMEIQLRSERDALTADNQRLKQALSFAVSCARSGENCSQEEIDEILGKDAK